MTKLKGVIAAAATPLKSDLSIDLDHLVRHCRWLMEEGGCDGVNLLGTTGEATSFSAPERIEAMRAVAKAGLPLERFMVGTGAASLDDAARLTSEAMELGFAGALLLPPFYYKNVDAEGLTAYVTALIERVGADGLKLYLYHFPQNSHLPYAFEVVRDLRDAFPDTLKGLKDSSGDIDYSARLARELPGFDVFPGSEGPLARAAELGFAGCISATANVTGRLVQEAWSGGKPASLDAAVEIRTAITKLPPVAAVKATLAMMTGDAGWRRVMPPLTALSDANFEALRDTLAGTALAADIGDDAKLRRAG